MYLISLCMFNVLNNVFMGMILNIVLFLVLEIFSVFINALRGVVFYFDDVVKICFFDVSKNVLYGLILLFLFVLFWVLFDVFYNFFIGEFSRIAFSRTFRVFSCVNNNLNGIVL